MNMVRRPVGIPSISAKKSNSIFYICLSLGILLCLRTVNDIFLWPTLIISLLTVVCASFQCSASMLFFLLPLGNIFKMDPEEFSFFTLIFAVFVFKLILIKKTDSVLFISCIGIAAYLILTSGTDQIASIATTILGFLFLYHCLSESVELTSVIVAFSIGIIIASVLGLLHEQLPIVDEFVAQSKMKLGADEYANRFAGLQGNPNYFTLDISLALSGLSIMLLTKKKIFFTFVLFSVLTIIGVMSVSKSFLFAWILMIVVLLIVAARMKSHVFSKLLTALIVSFLGIYLFASDAVNLFALRFASDEGNTISAITTGRTDLWVDYIKTLFSDLKLLFFGNGIGDWLGGKGSHNTYLDLLYLYGVVGSILYLYTVFRCYKLNMKSMSRQLLQYLPLLVFFIRSLAIGAIEYDSLFFYLVIIGVAMKNKTEVL